MSTPRKASRQPGREHLRETGGVDPLSAPVLDEESAAHLRQVLGLEAPKPPRKKARKRVDTLRDEAE